MARYADSGGYETDMYFRNAWRYRDYVVKSFNDDKPYDRFVQEQIAGDEIWPDDLALDGSYAMPKQKLEHLEARIGTGLYALGPQIHESNMDARKLDYERLTDWADTTGSVFLGLTLGCARCHDHKFDPISQADYYGLQAIFAGSREVEIPLINGMEIADFKQHYPRIVAVDEARRAYRLFEKRVAGRKLSAEEENEKRALRDKIAAAVLELPEQGASTPNDRFDGLMEVPTASVLGHVDPALVSDVHVLGRGDLDRPKRKVSPEVPAILRAASGYRQPLAGPFASRKQLALWLTQPENPLTARVMVNRVWQGHFGAGLVATPNDFGRMGLPPSHPELLDWLARRFVASGWSIKQLHRTIMLSDTYQRASAYENPDNLARDGDNRYLWRMNRRRLEAEALWDFVHAAAGTINLKAGGRPVVPKLADDEMSALREPWQWTVSADPAEHTRRGLYLLVRRNFRFPMFEAFDSPVNSVSSAKRDVTIVAPQALWSLNNRRAFGQATAVRRPAGARSGRRAGGLRRTGLGDRAFAAAERNRKVGGAGTGRRAGIERRLVAAAGEPAGRAGQASARTGRGAGEVLPGGVQFERVLVRGLRHPPMKSTCCHRHDVPLTRREALVRSGSGLGAVALGFLLSRDGLAGGPAIPSADARRRRQSAARRGRRIFRPRPRA